MEPGTRKYPSIISSAVTHLRLTRASWATTDLTMVTEAFPNLKSLEAEYEWIKVDGKTKTWPSPRHKITDALLCLSHTLKSLSLTTHRDAIWYIGAGETMMTSPLRLLGKMSRLEDLTTESIWLFSKSPGPMGSVGTPLKLSELLPISLVRLNLVDYWGIPHCSGEHPIYFNGFRHLRNKPYYPDFPNNWTAMQFWGFVLSELVQDLWDESRRFGRYSNLREFTLTSQYLSGHTRATSFAADFRVFFASVGVNFRVVDPSPGY